MVFEGNAISEKILLKQAAKVFLPKLYVRVRTECRSSFCRESLMISSIAYYAYNYTRCSNYGSLLRMRQPTVTFDLNVVLY